MNNIEVALSDLVTKSHYPITHAVNRPCTLNKWIYKLSEDCDADIENVLSKGIIIQQHELSFLNPKDLQNNWRYFISEKGKSNLIYSGEEEFNEGMLYSVCCIYTDAKQDTYFNIRASLPITVYINGNKVCTSYYEYHIKSVSLIFELRSGVNTILITQEISSRYSQLSKEEYSFSVSVKPVSFIKAVDKYDIYYSSTIKIMYKNHSIVPQTHRANNELSLEIFPQYFSLNPVALEISVIVEDVSGNSVVHKVMEGERNIISISTLCDGPLHIKCETSGSDVYVFKGNYKELFLKARNKAEDIEFKNYIDYVFKFTSENFVFNNGKIELIYDKFLYILYSQFSRLLKSILCKKGMKNDYFSNFRPGDIVTFLMKSDVDNVYMPYTFFFPDNYVAGEKIKTVILMPYGTVMDLFPDIPNNIVRSEFQDFIVVTVYGRGGLNRDYVSESQILKIINSVYNSDFVDATNRYAVGVCSGALRVCGLAMRFPGLFAATALFGGTVRLDMSNPEYEELQNLEHVKIFNVYNIEDEHFNGSRVLYTNNLLKQEKSFIFDSFTHKELTESLVTTKVISNLIKCNADIPEKFSWFPQENMYTSAYWFTVVEFIDIRKKSYVEAVLTDNGYSIFTKNISKFKIQISEEHFSAQRELTIFNNCHKAIVFVNPPGILTICHTEKKLISSWQSTSMSPQVEYELKPEQLGIRAVYMKPHVILNPSAPIHNNSRATKKLKMIFRQPIREKVRNYVCNEIDDDNLSGEYCVIRFFDNINIFMKETNDFEKDIDLMNNVLIQSIINNRESYFILYADGNHNLYVYISSEDVIDTLSDLMLRFDTEKVFLSHFVIYYQEKFYYKSYSKILEYKKNI